MSDQPETLAAVLVAMRELTESQGRKPRTNIPTISVRAWNGIVNRIKAAAERERVEIRRDAEIEWTRIGYEERKAEEKSSPGNAAAMREALEWAAQFVELGVDDDLGADGQNLTTAAEMARDALTAPARNCDRPECADVESAWATYCAETNRADCKGFARWLFATAEGGDHA